MRFDPRSTGQITSAFDIKFTQENLKTCLSNPAIPMGKRLAPGRDAGGNLELNHSFGFLKIGPGVMMHYGTYPSSFRYSPNFWSASATWESHQSLRKVSILSHRSSVPLS